MSSSLIENTPTAQIAVEEKKSFVPTISFEAAPKIVPRPTTPQTSVPRPTSRNAHPDDAYARSPRSVSTSAPEAKRTGFALDAGKNFKVRSPQAPRISFAPAPTRAPAPVTGVPPAAGSPNKLQAYAKTHQDAPKRGRNAGPK